MKKEKRCFVREIVNYSVACRLEKLAYKEHKGLLGSDEMLTKTEDVSNTGMCLLWPDNFKCHFCKHRIDKGRKSSSCELTRCKFAMISFKIGANMLITVQIRGKVIEDIKAKIIWYKESEDNQVFHGWIGVEFFKTLDLV
ncbi:MAG: hypothetical protein GY817_03280 [bacterium]|nr:hypothetical protein [bacterium]